MTTSRSVFFMLLLFTIALITNSKKRKIIIDSDGSVNDAFALIWALQSFGDKLIEIEALTTVKTDLSPYDAFRNVIHMVNITKRSKMRKELLSIPIAKARINKTDDVDDDEDGLFGFSKIVNKYPDIFSIKKKTLKAFETASYSDELLIEIVNKYPNEITLITMGPLTNLYLAELKHPGIISLTKDIYILGGEFFNRSGNSNHALSEFNFNYDSNALYQLLNTMDGNLPNIFIFPLDTTNKVQFGLQEMSLLYTLLSTDIQTEIEMCRMKMEHDEDGVNDDIYDESDLYDSDRGHPENQDHDDLLCTQSGLMYIFYEKMMEEAIRENYMNGYCSCLQMADSSIIGYLLYPHLYDFRFVNCRVNAENGMIWYDSRLDVITKDTITIPNCFVNVDIDVDAVIHGFTRDSVYMMHSAYMDYMEYVMNQMDW